MLSQAAARVQSSCASCPALSSIDTSAVHQSNSVRGSLGRISRVAARATCPRCSHRFSLRGQNWEQPVTCPSCGRQLDVPDLPFAALPSVLHRKAERKPSRARDAPAATNGGDQRRRARMMAEAERQTNVRKLATGALLASQLAAGGQRGWLDSQFARMSGCFVLVASFLLWPAAVVTGLVGLLACRDSVAKGRAVVPLVCGLVFGALAILFALAVMSQ